jgi:Holliday junction resolvase RusA-like endonuclease
VSGQQALALAPTVAHRLFVTGRPFTKKTSQRIVFSKRKNRHFILQSAAAGGWEKTAVLQLRAQWAGRAPMGGPLHVRALVYRETKVGDALNYWQAVADALERAGVIVNDRLIVSWDGSRCLKDAARPRVEITISETEEP